MTSLAWRVAAAVAFVCAALVAAQPTDKEAESAAAEAETAAAAATTKASEPAECVSGHRKMDDGDCGGNCYCLGGHWVCPESDCGRGNFLQKLRSVEPLPLRRNKRVPLDGERCAPGITYMDECNVCICSMDGIKAHASCTFKVCPK